MRIFAIVFFLGLVSISLTGCATSITSPSAFSNENIMKLQQGMSSDDIMTLFGEPQDVRVAVCGMPPNTWTCTSWEYEGFFDESASFTFSGKPDALVLNDFSIDRD